MKEHLIRTTRAVKLIGLATLSTILASAASLAQEIIVDNQDANTRQIGFWWPSSGPNPYLGDSLYNQNRDGSFTWFPVLPKAGDYDVYAWWTYHPIRATSVPYRIKHDGGTFLAYVNQRDPALGGQWNMLGTYTFSAGVLPEISLFGKDGNMSADAVRFVLAEQKPWPEANCPCDVYYGRAVDQYVAWGGSLIPHGFEGGAATISCEPTEEHALINFKTLINSGTSDVTSLILYSVIDEPGVHYECGVILDSSLHPTNRVQTRQIKSFSGEWSDACMASVLDYCPE